MDFKAKERLETIYDFQRKYLDHLSQERLHQTKETRLPEWGVRKTAVEIKQI